MEKKGKKIKKAGSRILDKRKARKKLNSDLEIVSGQRKKAKQTKAYANQIHIKTIKPHAPPHC